MPRSLTPRAILEAQRLNTDAVFLVLMTVFMEGVTPDIRVVNNTENIFSRGQTFIGLPFRITLPADIEEILVNPCSIEMDNVDPRIWQSLRQLGFSPRVTIEVILAQEPNTPLIATSGLRLRDATATIRTVSASLVPDNMWQGGFPKDDFDPPQNIGLFS